MRTVREVRGVTQPPAAGPRPLALPRGQWGSCWLWAERPRSVRSGRSEGTVSVWRVRTAPQHPGQAWHMVGAGQ